MLERLTSEQILEWEAYNVLEPIGDWRGDFQTALLCCTISNLVKSIYGQKGGFTPSKITDFMPDWGMAIDKPLTETQTTKKMRDIFEAIADKKIRRAKKK